MTCCGDRNSRRLEFPIDFQPFHLFQMRFIRYQELKNLQDHWFSPFIRAFLWERVSTPTLPQQNAFWVEFGPIFACAQREFPEFPHRTERKCVFPWEIPVESQGSPSGNRVVEIDPSRAGNVCQAQSKRWLPLLPMCSFSIMETILTLNTSRNSLEE